MKTIKTIVILLLCLGWIFVTSYRYTPLNSAGALLTCRTGLLSVPVEEAPQLQLTGAFHPRIFVDSTGIPHIYGDNDNSTAFGLGYMHAKDRYFQMEMMSRTVLGELSAVYGARTMSSDAFWKPYGFDKKSAELLEDYKTSAPVFYAYLQAYADGVNAYLQQHGSQDPMYTILGESPRPWKTEYALLTTWYMSWSLTYFDHHVEQQQVLTTLPASVTDYFYPLRPAGLITILPSGKQVTMPQPEVQPSKMVAAAGMPEEKISPLQFKEGIGSNNWAVNGAKSKTGAAILANDPHLFLTLPEAFYETHLVTGKLNVYGFSIPGVPLIVSGHNERVSWGITNGEWDLVDRYQLKVKDDSLYWYAGKWIPFTQQRYSVAVKGAGQQVIKADFTVQGKVIREKDSSCYAQQWLPAAKSHSAKAIFELMRSGNWDDFKTALKGYSYPPQNFIYSDVDNNIGMVCAGQLPQRAPGFQGGLLDGTAEYQPARAMDTLWYTGNPARNFLFSANQQPVYNDVYFGTFRSGDNYRVSRINHLLETKNDWTPESIGAMQSDDVDGSWAAFREVLAKYPIPAECKELVDHLKGWNGEMKGNSHPALVYETIRRMMERNSARFAKEYLKVNRPPAFPYFTKYLLDDQFTVAGSPAKAELLHRVLKDADSLIRSRFDYEWDKKQYGAISTFTINHLTFIPGLGKEVRSMDGNVNTINMNANGMHPVFRAVYNMQKGNVNGYTILAGGQSGRINSRHYADQLSGWREGRYKATQFAGSPDALKNISQTILFK